MYFDVVTRRIPHQSKCSLHSCPPTSRFQPYTEPCSLSESCRQALIAAISILTQLFPHKREKIINPNASAGSSTARWKRPVHCFHCSALFRLPTIFMGAVAPFALPSVVMSVFPVFAVFVEHKWDADNERSEHERQ